MRSLLTLAGVGCTVSCSLLFDSASSNAVDADVVDAPLVDFDGNADACSASTAIKDGRNPALTGAQAIDLDGDGVDEVLLYSDAPVLGPAVFVSSRVCASGDAWVYQHVWKPTIDSAMPTEEVVHVQRVARTVGNEGEIRLAAMAEGITASWLASFALAGQEPVDGAAFSRALPQSAGGLECNDAEPPFAIIAGSFDDDATTGISDIVFAQSKQSWRYLVSSWNSPDDWNSQCVDGVVAGDLPEKLSGSGTRLALARLPALPGGQDSHLELRDSIISVCVAGSCKNQSWQGGDVVGVATTNVNFDDGHVDFVGWRSADPVELVATSLGKSGADIVMEHAFFSVPGAAPKQVVLLSQGTSDHALLLFETNLQLVDLSASGAILLDEEPLDFASDIVVAPNWGPEGAPEILLFRADTGAVQCVQAVDGDLVPC